MTMDAQNLERVLAEVGNPAVFFRNLEPGESIWSFPNEEFDWPDEYTHWIEEMRAWRESCILADQSYHMINLYIEGPDAVDLFSDIGVNNFDVFRNGDPPAAKQLVACTHDGWMIGDSILFHVDTDTFLSVGTALVHGWLQYHIATGDYDVSSDLAYHPIAPGNPRDFRFEVQGPNAKAVLGEILDDDYPDVGFFQMDTVSIDGNEFFALGHGMAGEPGLEIFGPYEHHDEIRSKILEVGESYGIRQLGSKSYKNANIESGWIPHYVPGIYHSDEMKDYREWLPADGYEATLSIGGSFDSDDITDYYVDPYEVGYGHIINFDHDFIGKEALKEKEANQSRTKVTLVWDSEDVIDVYASMFRDGDAYQYLDFPDTAMSRCDTVYDEVVKDGETIGISKTPGFDFAEREMLSLAVINTDFADPGTTVSLMWGDNSTKRNVERHLLTDIQATVAPVPYVTRREEM